MNDEMKKDYANSVDFWNNAFFESEEDKENDLKETVPEDAWRELSTADKILDAISTLKDYDKVLDYGCGYGWASVLMAKTGSRNINSVDVVPNSIDLAKHYAKVYGVEEATSFSHISFNWLEETEASQFDAAFCSNVIDVVPEEVANGIIKGLARVVKKGGRVIIGMNYYTEPKNDPERKIEIKEGNYMFVNGVLRLVLRTDEEWISLLEKYFEVEKLDHYAWAGEAEEKRRLFFLKVK